MAKTKDVIKRVVEIVADETEVSCDRILSKDRVVEVVDARHIVVVALAKIGVYKSRIAHELRITPRNVQYILTYFDSRIACNKPLRNKYEIIAKRLRNGLEITAL